MGISKNKVLCIGLLLFFIFASCGKNNTNQKPRLMDEEYPWLQNNAGVITTEQKNKVRTKAEIRYAIAGQDNTPVFSNADFNSEVVSYLHTGDTVASSRRTMEKVRNKKYFHAFSSGWIYGGDLEFVEIIDSDTTTLTNSETVDHTNFPIPPFVFGYLYTCLESFPAYLNETTPWVVYNGDFEIFKDKFGLTIHLQNQPDEYEVWIYNQSDSGYKKYIAKKEEINIDEYDFLEDEERLRIKRILPLYQFYFPAWVSAAGQRLKTEIRSMDGDLLYSTDIEFPKKPFIARQIHERCFYLQYSGDSPLYIVLYKPGEREERIPEKALAIQPKDGFWDGILNISQNFIIHYELRLLLFKKDNENPDDYSQPLNNYFPYNVTPE
jgi:hypothetical protein